MRTGIGQHDAPRSTRFLGLCLSSLVSCSPSVPPSSFFVLAGPCGERAPIAIAPDAPGEGGVSSGRNGRNGNTNSREVAVSAGCRADMSGSMMVN